MRRGIQWSKTSIDHLVSSYNWVSLFSVFLSTRTTLWFFFWFMKIIITTNPFKSHHFVSINFFSILVIFLISLIANRFDGYGSVEPIELSTEPGILSVLVKSVQIGISYYRMTDTRFQERVESLANPGLWVYQMWSS